MIIAYNYACSAGNSKCIYLKIHAKTHTQLDIVDIYSKSTSCVEQLGPNCGLLHNGPGIIHIEIDVAHKMIALTINITYHKAMSCRFRSHQHIVFLRVCSASVP